MSGEKENVMRDLQVDKLIINISVGTSGDPLTKAAKVLKQLTSIDGSDGQQPVESKGAPPPARLRAMLARRAPAVGRAARREQGAGLRGAIGSRRSPGQHAARRPAHGRSARS